MTKREEAEENKRVYDEEEEKEWGGDDAAHQPPPQPSEPLPSYVPQISPLIQTFVQLVSANPGEKPQMVPYNETLHQGMKQLIIRPPQAIQKLMTDFGNFRIRAVRTCSNGHEYYAQLALEDPLSGLADAVPGALLDVSINHRGASKRNRANPNQQSQNNETDGYNVPQTVKIQPTTTLYLKKVGNRFVIKVMERPMSNDRCILTVCVQKPTIDDMIRNALQTFGPGNVWCNWDGRAWLSRFLEANGLLDGELWRFLGGPEPLSVLEKTQMKRQLENQTCTKQR